MDVLVVDVAPMPAATVILEPFRNRSRLWRMRSDAAPVHLRNRSLDLVFIDGDHSYEAVKRDIALWTPKVACRGILSGHDYSHVFLGVIEA
eukprot:4532571-Amphidinium_carterae.1